MDTGYTSIYEQPMAISSTSSVTLSGEQIFAIMAWATIFALISYVLNSYFLGKLFKKAGVASWQAWVPILNTWKTYEIGGRQGYWAILALVPIVNIVSAVFMIIAVYNINLKIKHGAGMTVLAFFLPLIWIIIASSSKNQWDDNLGAPSVAKESAPSGAENDPAQNEAVVDTFAAEEVPRTEEDIIEKEVVSTEVSQQPIVNDVYPPSTPAQEGQTPSNDDIKPPTEQ